ncbi:5'/3'-nucleotidase SurE [Crocosphaera chwakensis]|uniref:5'-nucleotidase n=1 Tax=Crocosphaera chwakensis CCY0110 TaxID=391612 RepID=A3IZH6_9CHRO|nr:5'/3'-nucleotidase SurE [Crocosphaera chwakensis]EAZ88117.1 glycerophosphodiester phosphodiesterase [Crocosphaera chwakensis CCY0110]
MVISANELDNLTGSLSNFIGFENGSYYIEVPEGKIDEFFQWDINYPELISAHRGGFKTGFPENAIATFEQTLTTAPALLEVDVRRTGDGQWILMHDEDLSRTTNGTGLVEETSLAEIKTLRLKDNQGNLTPYQVPTLEEALLWAEGRTILELDLKSDDYTEEVVEIITQTQAEDQVRFITDNMEQATQIYNQNPEIHLGLFIVPNNQETVLSDIETAPFTLDKVSAFTGTQPQSEVFYQGLHEQGIVAIQGLFGQQDTFNTSINELNIQQRESLFETVFTDGGDVIASDYYQQIAQIIEYPVEDELEILLVNDDGFEAEGINVLFEGLKAAGYDVTLVAPKEQQSGRGTLINVDKIFQPTEVVNFEPNKWFVDGSPIVTTLAGLDYILDEEPDLVISGINEGANIGENVVISSGTVSAATTATRRGIPSIAVSAGGNTLSELEVAYEEGTALIIDIIETLEAQRLPEAELLPEGVGLNINIPGTFAEGVNGIQGVVLTELDEISNLEFSFGELPPNFGEGAGVLVNLNENITPSEVENEMSEGENFLAGFMTITPIDGSWVASSDIRESIEARTMLDIALPEFVPLDILLTNDDGFEAEGIEVIYNTLTEAGHNVSLVAPKEQQSGTGTALDVDSIFQPTEVVNFEENKWYVDAGVRTTTWAGLDFILEGETPDLVISGINEGENIGPGGAVSSGTVSAAVSAILRDIPAIAVSAGIDLENEQDNLTSEAYEIGANYVTDLIAQLQATQGNDATILPKGTGLSINIPVRFPEGISQIQGVAFTEPDNIEPFAIDFGELPPNFGGGAGLRFFPTELPPEQEISPLSEGGQFLSGLITVTTLDGNWTASQEKIDIVDDLLSNVLSQPLPQTVFGTANADFFDTEVPDENNFIGDNQILFTGSGDDWVDVTFAPGDNRIDLGSGDDFLFGGTNNRIIAGTGDDTLFVGSAGGNNVITGGEGMDRFWIVTDGVDLPSQANTITDFTNGEDKIGFATVDLDFEELTLTQDGSSAVIKAFEQDLAILLNTEVSALSSSDFVFA